MTSVRLILLSLLFLLPWPVRAQAQVEPGRAEYEQASALYRAGEYQRALPLFEAAYARSGRRPPTIYALAQCERQLALLEPALRHYREYVALTPRPPEADTALERIQELEAQLGAQAGEPAGPRATPAEPGPAPATQSNEPPSPPEPAPPAPVLPGVDPRPDPEATAETQLQGDLRPLPEPAPVMEEGPSVLKISLLVASAAALVTAGVFGVRAYQAERDVDAEIMARARPASEVRALADSGFQSAVLADVFAGGAALALLGGLLLD